MNPNTSGHHLCQPLVLIAGRIWWINRQAGSAAEKISGRKLGPTIIIIIESGAIYSACLIILLSLYVSGSYAQYIFLDGVSCPVPARIRS
jgi:hypothetical protein